MSAFSHDESFITGKNKKLPGCTSPMKVKRIYLDLFLSLPLIKEHLNVNCVYLVAEIMMFDP